MARSTFDVPQLLRRIVARRTAAWLVCAVAGAWSAPAALAEDSRAPIVIPGPGEQNSADLARMTQIATSSNGSTRALAPQTTPSPPATAASVTDRFAALENASGAIVIPGPGEAPGAASSGSFEIDSLASRGEPPELGASAPGRPPATRSAASLQTQAALPNQAQALAQAAQRAQAVQALRQAQVAQVVVNPSAEPARPMAASQAAQAGRSTQATQTAQVAPGAPGAQAAQAVPAGQQDGEAIRAAALDFLKQQAVGLPGRVELTVAPAFPRGLAACTTLQPFMPNGARMWGRTTVGVRCASGHPWTVWLQAKVSIHATYYVAARAMVPGEVITEADLVSRDGDLTLLPMSIITAPSEAIGSVTLMRVGAGLPLRQDMLKNAAQVTAGQMVRVVAQGNGFSISSEGSALSSATPGQPVKVRTSTGQIIMGIVKDSSTVQIQM